jgi:hypothetical protein
MLPIQPTNWWSYLHQQKITIPDSLSHYFYTSWEDALWNLLLYFQIKPGSTALVPAFFCGDVVANMADHGLDSVFYPVNQSLQSDPKVFKQYLKKYQPQVVIIFHAVGITNPLWQQRKVWLSALPKNCLLIEDSVHRVIDPSTIKLISARHVVIDSLRKVVPIPGANVFMDRRFDDLAQYQQPNYSYSYALLFWWLTFQLCLLISQLSISISWSKLWNKLAEQTMLRGYDLIGDNPTGGAGWQWAKWLAAHLDINKITSSKQRQVKKYQQALTPSLKKKNSPFFAIPFPDSDAGLLRGYPLGIKIKLAPKILTYLRSQGLLTRFELNDCPWSTKYKIIYLPLGPHLNHKQISWVCQTTTAAAAMFSSPSQPR